MVTPYSNMIKLIGLSPVVKLNKKLDETSYLDWLVYQPPESFQRSNPKLRFHSFEQIVWQLGVILYFFLSGLNPFDYKTEQQTINAIQTQPVSFDNQRFQHTGAGAKDLITKMLTERPDQKDKIRRHFQTCVNESSIIKMLFGFIGPND